MSPRISSLISSDAVRQHVPWAEFEYAILESPSEVKFLALKGREPEGCEPESFSTGTLFGDKAELRWRRRRTGRFHLVMVHDAGRALEGDEGLALQPAESAKNAALPSTVLLWKAQDEPRIPKPIVYPGLPDGSRPAVRLKSYWLQEDTAPETDRVLITRYVTLADGEGEP
ncbi:MAG: hypothetical protein LAO20_22880 [Acidobacteriia bacterium]|nr:hypothetical protein [Terriglobia bacterium]